MRPLLRAALAALTLAALASPASVAAQDGAVPLTGAEFSEDNGGFPQSLTLRVTVPAPPEEFDLAEARYAVDALSCAEGVTTQEGELAVADDGAVSASWEWDVADDGGLPPGAVVRYRWRFTGEGGAVYETEERAYVYEDARFAWSALAGERVTLLHYGEDEAFARGLLAWADASMEEIAGRLSVPPGERVHLRVYEDADTLQGALISTPEHVGGVAWPEHSLSAVGVNPGNVRWGRSVIGHELAHVVVGRKTFSCGADLPRHLNEGLAMWYGEGRLAGAFRLALDAAVAEDRVYRLAGLASAFPDDYDGALLAYAQGWSIVDYLIGTHGHDAMDAMLTAFGETGSIQRALIAAYGYGRAELEDRWRASVGLEALPPLAPPTPSLPEIPPLLVPTPLPTATPPGPLKGERDGGPTATPPTATAPPAAAPTPTAASAPTPTATAATEAGAGCGRSGDASGATPADAALAALLLATAAGSLRRVR